MNMDETLDSDRPVAGGDRAAAPWGFWATLVFSVVLTAAYLATAMGVGVAFTKLQVAGDSGPDLQTYVDILESNGLYLSAASIATALVCSGLIFLFAWLRRRITVSDYLGLKRVPAAALWRWILVIVLFAVVYDVSNFLLGQDIVPQVMVEAYVTAGIVSLFWISVVVAAPIFEELFFRGFIFAGLAASRLGPKWTIGLTAIIWGSIHLQYDLYDVSTICVLGIFLGVARVKTGSVYAPMAMHALLNLFATIEVALLTRASG